MMKRQVLECGIQVSLSFFGVSIFKSVPVQDISKDAAKFVSDALDIYLQVDYILHHFAVACLTLCPRNSFKG